MKADYDRETDVLTVLFGDSPVAESDAIRSGVIVDYDNSGNVVGLEIPDAGRRVSNPATMEFAVRAA